MENREELRAAGSPLSNQFHHRVAILAVKRGGRLVEDEQAMVAGEAPRDIDALLLASG